MSRLNLPYLFCKLTLDFLAFSVMVHAAGARRGRGIYHLIEDSKGYRAVYGTCGAPRGGRFFGVRGRGAAARELPYLSRSYPRLFDKSHHGARHGHPMLTRHIPFDREKRELSIGI